jgi:hypothetical protein
MRYGHIGKLAEDEYTISSLPCPTCSSILTINLDGLHLFLLNQGSLIQEVLPNESRATRETFLTGYCSPCWSNIFGEDED